VSPKTRPLSSPFQTMRGRGFTRIELGLPRRSDSWQVWSCRPISAMDYNAVPWCPQVCCAVADSAAPRHRLGTIRLAPTDHAGMGRSILTIYALYFKLQKGRHLLPAYALSQTRFYARQRRRVQTISLIARHASYVRLRQCHWLLAYILPTSWASPERSSSPRGQIQRGQIQRD
jgi:hypothetical protein